jgi:RimJ/RimL family protein N-acetyltransferase
MSAGFNIKIQASQRGNGYAKEAMTIFLDYCFRFLNIQEITDEIAMNNTISQKLFIDYGFTHYPDLSEHFWVSLKKEEFFRRYPSVTYTVF